MVVAATLSEPADGMRGSRESTRSGRQQRGSAMTRFDPVEAERLMRWAGLLPLDPFPGVHKPWRSVHVACGIEIAPLLSNVRRRGTACRQCGASKRGAIRRASTAERAVQRMLAAGFEPLEAYPGSAKPWLCMHLACGEERTPSLNTIRANGTSCRPCSLAARGQKAWTAADARAFFLASGLQPLEPYPGSSSKRWRSMHLPCGRLVSPRLGNLVQGQGPCRECGLAATHRAQRLQEEAACRLMRERGLEPASPFPGVDSPWRSTHMPCGREVSPSYSNIKKGQGGCISCAARSAADLLRLPEAEAVAVFEQAGLHPIEPYVASNRPWSARHVCGRVVSPTLSNVRSGRGICRYCNSSFPYGGPAVLYLVAKQTALKIGIAATDGQRLETHRRHGWLLHWVVELPTGDAAYNAEQGVIAHWREMGLSAALTATDMPQGGATETVSTARVGSAEVLAWVLRLLEGQGFAAPSVHSSAWP